MSVKTYSLKNDGDTALSTHFYVYQFKCKDGSDTILIDSDLVNRLESIYNVFGGGITITSAYRTSAYNAKVSTSTGSQHVEGKAADIQVRGVPP